MSLTKSHALIAVGLDTYEAAAQAAAELGWAIARKSESETLGWLAASWADLIRDATAVQLSVARWVLDQ